MQNVFTAISVLEENLSQELARIDGQIDALSEKRLDLSRKLEAARLTKTLFPEGGETPAKTVSIGSGMPARGEVDQAVKSAVESLGNEFTSSEVEERLAAEQPFNSASIRSVLRRLEGKSISVKARGAGRRPTSYVKIPS